MDNTKKPLVSIITPSYNTAPFIGETIESVLAQTFPEWEMIIVDDASTDNSPQIIRQYAEKDPRIKPVFLKENKGQGPARNIATDLAQGKYLAFLDSDDIWHPEKLEKHLTFMQQTGAVFSHTSYGFIDEQGNKIFKDFHVSRKPVTYKDLLKRNIIGCLTVIYDSSKLGKLYMPDIRRKQDYKLWLTILKKGYLSQPLNEVLSFYRIRKNSITSNKRNLFMEHYLFLRNHENLSIFKSIYYTLYWGVLSIKKYYFSKI